MNRKNAPSHRVVYWIRGGLVFRYSAPLCLMMLYVNGRAQMANQKSDNAIRGRGGQVGGPVSRKSPPEADVGAPTPCVTAVVRHSLPGATITLDKPAFVLVVVGWLIVVGCCCWNTGLSGGH